MHVLAFATGPRFATLAGMALATGLFAGSIACMLANALPRDIPAQLRLRSRLPGRARRTRNVGLFALGAVAAWACTASQLDANTVSQARTWVPITLNALLAAAAVSASCIDAEHMVLPNEITLGGAALALATSPWRPLGLLHSGEGLVTAIAITLLPAIVYAKIKGQSGTGLGDAKFTMLAGAWLGPFGALFVTLAAYVQAAIVSVLMRLLKRQFRIPASVIASLEDLRERALHGDADAQAILEADPLAAAWLTREGSTQNTTTAVPMGPLFTTACVAYAAAPDAIQKAAASLFGSS